MKHFHQIIEHVFNFQLVSRSIPFDSDLDILEELFRFGIVLVDELVSDLIELMFLELFRLTIMLLDFVVVVIICYDSFKLFMMFLAKKFEEYTAIEMNNMGFTNTFLTDQLLEPAEILSTDPDDRGAMKSTIARINHILHLDYNLY